MQLDPRSEKLNFDLFDPTIKSTQRGQTQAIDWKSRLMWLIFIVPLSACKISVKKIDNLSYCKIQIFDVWPHLRGQGVGVKF